MKYSTWRRVSVSLLLAGTCFYLFPEMLQAVIFYIKQSSLPGWVSLMCGFGGVLAGMVFMLLAMKAAFSRPGQKNRGVFGRFVAGMLAAVFVYLFFDFILEKIYGILMKLFAPQYAAPTVIFGCLVLVSVFLQGFCVYLWLTGCMPEPLPRPLRTLLRHPLVLAGTVLLTAAAGAVPDGCGAIIGLMPETVKVNISIRFLIWLFIAFLHAMVLSLLFRIIAAMAEKERLRSRTLSEGEQTGEGLPPAGDSGTEERPAARGSLRYPAALVSAAGIAVLLLIQGISDWRQNPVEVICDSIDENLSLASIRLAGGDMEGGLKDMETAAMTLNVWSAVFELQGTSSLSRIYAEEPSNPLICYLYSLKSGQTEPLERYLRINEMSPEIGLALLDLYARSDSLTEQQEIIRDELKYICAATGTYTQPWLSPDQLEDYRERLELALNNYDWLGERLEILRAAVSVLRDGVVDRETVDKCLLLAEENQNDWIAQLMAATAGSGLQYDGAGHYERTIQAAIRYEQLYREAFSPEGEELAALELKAARMIIACYGYQQALPYVEKAVELGSLEEAFSIAARCYEALERYEDCYRLCVGLLEENPRQVSARYYAAVSALKAGMRDEAILQTSLLADTVRDSVTQSDYGADVALYTMLQFIAVNDNGSWTEYQYEFYSDMTESQRAAVEENSFFADYLDAVYLCFSSGEEGREEKALQLVSHVLEENPYLPQAWYLKGAILYQMKEFEESAAAYGRSLEIAGNSATVWYALANAYDGMEEYQLAYEACERTMALLPEQDHGSDWYGVSIHCDNLMRALENKLEGR